MSLGIRLRRSELRESIHRVDHENVQRRRSHVVKRRQYSVDCPNSIWHIDGHHKLIRWRFVTRFWKTRNIAQDVILSKTTICVNE